MILVDTYPLFIRIYYQSRCPGYKIQGYPLEDGKYTEGRWLWLNCEG